MFRRLESGEGRTLMRDILAYVHRAPGRKKCTHKWVAFMRIRKDPQATVTLRWLFYRRLSLPCCARLVRGIILDGDTLHTSPGMIREVCAHSRVDLNSPGGENSYGIRLTLEYAMDRGESDIIRALRKASQRVNKRFSVSHWYPQEHDEIELAEIEFIKNKKKEQCLREIRRWYPRVHVWRSVFNYYFSPKQGWKKHARH